MVGRGSSERYFWFKEGHTVYQVYRNDIYLLRTLFCRRAKITTSIVSRMTHRHGHSVGWMPMGGNNSLMCEEHACTLTRALSIFEFLTLVRCQLSDKPNHLSNFGQKPKKHRNNRPRSDVNKEAFYESDSLPFFHLLFVRHIFYLSRLCL